MTRPASARVPAPAQRPIQSDSPKHLTERKRPLWRRTGDTPCHPRLRRTHLLAVDACGGAPSGWPEIPGMSDAAGIKKHPAGRCRQLNLQLFRRFTRWSAAVFCAALTAIVVAWGISTYWHVEYRFGLSSVGIWSGRLEAEWGTLSIATSEAANELGWRFRPRQPDQQFVNRIGFRWPTAHVHRHATRPWGDLAIPLWAPALAALIGATVSWLGRGARGWRDVAMALGIGAAGATMVTWFASAFLQARFETGRGPFDVALVDGTLTLTRGRSSSPFSDASGGHYTWTNSGYHLLIDRRNDVVPVPWGQRIGARLPDSISGAQVPQSTGSGGFVFPMWCGAVPVTLFAAMMVRLRRGYIAPGHCPKCGYDLTANASGVCPECGMPVNGAPAITPPTAPRETRPPPSRERPRLT